MTTADFIRQHADGMAVLLFAAKCLTDNSTARGYRLQQIGRFLLRQTGVEHIADQMAIDDTLTKQTKPARTRAELDAINPHIKQIPKIDNTADALQAAASVRLMRPDFLSAACGILVYGRPEDLPITAAELDFFKKLKEIWYE